MQVSHFGPHFGPHSGPRAVGPFLTIMLVMAVGGLACGWLSACKAPSPQGVLEASFRQDQIDLMVKTLAEAPSHGFRPGAFGATPAGVRAGDAEAVARLHASIVRYALAQHGLSIPRQAFAADWGIRPQPYDAEAGLVDAVRRNQLAAWLAALPPPSPAYRALRDGYLAYQKAMTSGGWASIPDGPELAPGASGPRVQALEARLAVEDPSVETSPDRPYGADLALAVQRFQARYGVEPTGRVGPDTLRALNIPIQTRLAQIRANLERLRWLPRIQPAEQIAVNTAAATLDVDAAGPPVRLRVVAGRPGDESPMLVSTIHTIVLNPAWNVPDGIADKELFPKQSSDPGFFEREGFQVDPAGGGTRLVQAPGPKNALGQVKFEFPNPYSVYLHDTPAKAVFGRDHRSVSHGCVRVEHAVDLARRLLSREPDWPPDRIDEALAGGDTVRISLSHPTPVALYYWTAFAQGGAISFRDDVYGWDQQVLRLLDAAGSGLA